MKSPLGAREHCSSPEQSPCQVVTVGVCGGPAAKEHVLTLGSWGAFFEGWYNLQKPPAGVRPGGCPAARRSWATQAREVSTGSEGPAPTRALMPCLHQHVDQLRHALALETQACLGAERSRARISRYWQAADGCDGIARAIREALRPRACSIVGGLATDLLRTRAELVAENALLRQQLVVVARRVKRPIFRRHERAAVALLTAALPRWKDALLLKERRCRLTQDPPRVSRKFENWRSGLGRVRMPCEDCSPSGIAARVWRIRNHGPSHGPPCGRRQRPVP
jgi:hypothetical protein